ncbi:hypothetical protein Tco_0527247 [Tanacetum coccineum]
MGKLENSGHRFLPVTALGNTSFICYFPATRSFNFGNKGNIKITLSLRSDGSTDGLHVPRSANLSQLKEELEDSFSELVPNYRITYLEGVIATNFEWRNCVKAFGSTGNPCMKLSILE